MPEDEFEYVNNSRRLADLVDAIRSSESIGLDTEFIGENAYEPLLCLVQLAAAGRTWILDPLAVNGLEPFWEALTDPDKVVIALAAREEIRFCLRYARRAPGHLFDPQIVAGLVGHGYPLSHTNLVKNVLEVQVNGRETFTDWKQRPLTPHQLEYAADDVRHLHALRDTLTAQAGKLNRLEWLEPECHRLVDRVADDEREERWWKVSGSTSLGRRELATLRELWRWRDATARDLNVPARRVLKDELMVEIAKRKPASTADLFALRGFDRGDLRKIGGELVKAVQMAMALPQADLPTTLRRDDPPQVGVLGQLLSLASNGVAAENRVDPQLLATVSDLQDLVRWKLGVNGSEAPAVLEGWRGELLGKPLLEVLEGKRHLRVTSLKSPNPLAFEERPG